MAQHYQGMRQFELQRSDMQAALMIATRVVSAAPAWVPTQAFLGGVPQCNHGRRTCHKGLQRPAPHSATHLNLNAPLARHPLPSSRRPPCPTPPHLHPISTPCYSPSSTPPPTPCNPTSAARHPFLTPPTLYPTPFLTPLTLYPTPSSPLPRSTPPPSSPLPPSTPPPFHIPHNPISTLHHSPPLPPPALTPLDPPPLPPRSCAALASSARSPPPPSQIPRSWKPWGRAQTSTATSSPRALPPGACCPPPGTREAARKLHQLLHWWRS